MRNVNTKLQSIKQLLFFWLPLMTTLVAFLALVVWVRMSSAEETVQLTYATAEQASQALYAAVQNDNGPAILQILGGRQELASSGDDLADKAERKQFAAKYREMHRLVRQSDGTMVLYIGAENWPFPVPLTLEKGKWRFDADAGTEEIFFRQIGEHEAVAIRLCHALVRVFTGGTSNSGSDDGLITYAQTLAGARAAASRTPAKAQGTSAPFDGYYFRQVSTDSDIVDGAVVFVAYPAQYRSSGVMTFVVTSDDVVFQKDLGPNTARLANAIDKTTPDLSWQLAE
jgi:hypothetical protein